MYDCTVLQMLYTLSNIFTFDLRPKTYLARSLREMDPVQFLTLPPLSTERMRSKVPQVACEGKSVWYHISMRRYFFTLFFLFLSCVPFVSGAADTGIVTCGGAGQEMCQTCDFIALGNNVLQWIIGIMATVCAVVVAVAGLKMVTAGGNMGAIESAKGMITNVIVGFMLMLAAWLIVDTVIKVFISEDGEIPGYGPWNEIECVDQPAPSSTSSSTPPGPTTGVGVSGNVAATAEQMLGFNTAGGPGDGNVACAWAVNQVLGAAGIPPLDGDSVRSMEGALTSGRGTLVDQSSAKPGDIVIVTDGSRAHTGICLNAGCTRVVSNSSSRKSFSWVSGPDFKPSYNAGVGRIYRLGK